MEERPTLAVLHYNPLRQQRPSHSQTLLYSETPFLYHSAHPSAHSSCPKIRNIMAEPQDSAAPSRPNDSATMKQRLLELQKLNERHEQVSLLGRNLHERDMLIRWHFIRNSRRFVGLHLQWSGSEVSNARCLASRRAQGPTVGRREAAHSGSRAGDGDVQESHTRNRVWIASLHPLYSC